MNHIKRIVFLSASMFGVFAGIALCDYWTTVTISNPIFLFGSMTAMLLILVTSLAQGRKHHKMKTTRIGEYESSLSYFT